MKKRWIALCCAVIMLLMMMPVIPAVAETPKLVAITFDDGPSAYTERLLDGLKSRGAKATFFIVGNMASSRMNTVKRAVREGHQIANHTTTHPDMTTLSADSIRSELSRCRSYLVQAAGEQTFALRPPYGSHNATVRANAGGPVILWSVDTLDWKSLNANSVYNKIVNETKDGSIVLLHDLYSTSVDAALRAIDTLQDRGYECVTVNELFRRRGITLQSGNTYSCAYNKGITLPALEAPKAPTLKTKNVTSGKNVILSCPTEGAEIRYTTDGSQPTEQSTKYTKKFKITQTTRIRAVAYKDGYGGEMLDQTVTLQTAPAPEISYQKGIATLTAAKGTKLYYTTSTSLPTKKSALYESGVEVKKRLNVLVTASGKADRLVQYTFTKYGAILTDVSAGAWYYSWIGEAIHRGIMKGMGDLQFAPEESVTRAMFVTSLYRMSPDAKSTFKGTTFTDVEAGAWYSKAVAWAQQKNIVKGISETEYQPESNITREQMCSILHRYIKVYGYTLPTGEGGTFEDAQQISRWAKKDVAALTAMQLIGGMGDGRFAPKENATRAQCAKLLVDLAVKIESVQGESL